MRSRLATTSRDQALAWISQHHTNHAVHMSGGAEGFRFERRSLDAGSFAIVLLHHRGGLKMDVDPCDLLMVIHLQAGRYSAACRKVSVELGAGDTALYPLSARCRVYWENPRLDLVRLDRLAAAEAVGGKDADIIPLDVRPISPARARSWHSLTRHIAREMSPTGTMSSPLVCKSAFGLLAATFTQTFPCRIPIFVRRYAVSNPSEVVRRAVEFIESHAHKPIGLSDIAEAARIGPRGLQVAFRRHLDSTPTEYLRRVRLDHAHRHLAAGTPTRDTVGRIAARWGWANVSRFSRLYQEHYGCSPQVTLQI